ncbi:aminopeptidase N [Demetria terragena]|uniref:aminopeptidase N n=1 Tax=Demetria terragena TaxID=63959 RepID=UPI000372214C|nr:aminopeptidase N [Demetria terragena]
MTSTANLSQDECAARAAIVTPESYLIEVDLRDASQPDTTTFPSRTTLYFDATPGADTWVDLIADTVDRATLNGEDLDLTGYDGARLPVPGLADRNELVVVAQCAYSRTGEGMHRFTDPEDGETYLYTHFEPTDARRVFANFEQPDLKAHFTMQVTAPVGWVVRSGQPEIERDEIVNARGNRCVTVKFAPTPTLSTYITAIVAGPYHQVQDQWEVERADGSSHTIPLMLLCRQSMAAHLDTADIFEVTKQGLSYYDEKFKFPYPWGKYDQIFVPEYNLGAMENPGLVTFTETYLHRGYSTVHQRAQRTNTIMHEMAHMWFGDLATMRWWDGLWLKESFADLMGYHVCSAATKYDIAWSSFALGSKAKAYRADQLPSTHPVVATIRDLEAARQNFDGITYAKGASVIKQLMAYVGEDAFFAGAATYFERHAYGSTELSDLLTCLEESSGRELRSWSRAWLETSGVTTLSPLVERDGEGRITRLALQQKGIDASTGSPVLRPHHLNVGLYTVVDDRLERTRLLTLDAKDELTEVSEAHGERADLILVNDEDLTYAKATLDTASQSALDQHLSTLTSPLARGIAWANLWNSTRDAQFTASQFLDVVERQLPSEPEAFIVSTVERLARYAACHYVPEPEREEANDRHLATAYESLLASEPSSDTQQSWARALAAMVGHSPNGVPRGRDLLSGHQVVEGLDIDRELRWMLLTGLTAQDATTPEELADELRRDASMSGHTACVTARAARPSVEAKEQTWQRITDGADVTNDELRALIAGFTEPSGAELIEDYAPRYYASLTTWWSQHSQTMATIMARGLFPQGSLRPGERPEEASAAAAAASWLRDHQDAPAALRRVVSERYDDLLRDLRAQEFAMAPTGSAHPAR